MHDIDAVLLTELGQSASRFIARIGIGIVFHDVTEFAPAASDLDDLGTRFQVQVNEPPDLVMTAAETPIERRYLAVIGGIEARRGSVDEPAAPSI